MLLKVWHSLQENQARTLFDHLKASFLLYLIDFLLLCSAGIC